MEPLSALGFQRWNGIPFPMTEGCLHSDVDKMNHSYCALGTQVHFSLLLKGCLPRMYLQRVMVLFLVVMIMMREE